MAVTEAPTRATTPTGSVCPSCSAPAEPGQLLCIECGARIGLRYRPRPRRRAATLLLAALALLAAAGIGFGARAVTDGDEVERAGGPPPEQGSGASLAGEDSSRADRGAPDRDAREDRPSGGEAPRGEGGVREWPDGRDAYTVVLLSAGDEESARGRARELIEDGVQAGVLQSGLYPTLEAGFWLVFSGVYETQEQAQEVAQELAGRAPGAFPQLVNGSEKRSTPASAEPEPGEEDTSTEPDASTGPNSDQGDQ